MDPQNRLWYSPSSSDVNRPYSALCAQYDRLIPFLTQEPLDVTLKKMEDLDERVVFEPPAFIPSPALNLQAALAYLARRRGLSEMDIAMMTYALDFAHVELAKSDLALADTLPDSHRRSLKLACKQLTRSAAELGKRKLLFDDGLLKCQRFVTEMDTMAEALPAT